MGFFKTAGMTVVTVLYLGQSLSTVVAAASLPRKEIAKRGPYANEMLYLSRCDYYDLTYGSMLWYKEGMDASQSDQVPNDVMDYNATQMWAGSVISGLFNDSGITVTTHIQKNGTKLPFRMFSGTAMDSNGQAYDCFRDNGRLIFSLTGGETCYSDFWCTDVS